MRISCSWHLGHATELIFFDIVLTSNFIYLIPVRWGNRSRLKYLGYTAMLFTVLDRFQKRVFNGFEMC